MTQSQGRLKLGVLISGGGRTLVNIADCIDAGTLDAEIATVIAHRENLPGVARARDRGLPVVIINSETLGNESSVDEAITQQLLDSQVDLVCLAGYIRYLKIYDAFSGRVMNIHPALLPAFGGKGMYGERVHKAVLEHGCRISGCTAHFVDEEYDNGPIIMQKACAVLDDDTPETLAARVFALECKAYPEAIQLFAEGRLLVSGRRVQISPLDPASV